MKKRISRLEEYKKIVYTQNYTDGATANGLLKDGQQFDVDIGVVVKGMTFGDLNDAVVDQYFLDDAIKERLIIHYHVSISNKDAKKKAKYIDEDDNRILTLDSLALGGYTLMMKCKCKKAGQERDNH